MKIIEKLSDFIDEEINDAEKYIKCALKLKEDDAILSKTFYDLSLEETKHIEMLHNAVVILINDYKAKVGEPPADMQALYTYIHEKHIEQVSQIKLMQMQYRS